MCHKGVSSPNYGMKSMDDFEEIGHAGGKIHINIDKRGYQFEIENSNANAFTIRSVNIDIQGLKVMIPLISDKVGMFGYRCPECEGYFRSSGGSENIYCPYCGYIDVELNFLTDNQRKYIERYLKEFLKAIQKRQSITIDFDSIINGLESNISGFAYSEEKQQTTFKCDKCNVAIDIIGIYGYCPRCGKRNSYQILTKNIEFLQERVSNPRYSKIDREKRESEWGDIIKNLVSEYEAFCNDIVNEIVKIPMTPRQKNDIKQISFQNLKSSTEKLKRYFEIDMLEGVSEVDKKFINTIFNKRHLLTHKNGIVDDEYLTNTGDASVKVRQKIRIRSAEVQRAINLVEIISNNLFEAFESFS